MARAGMTAILEELRGMCEASATEYTVGTTVYWGDSSLQDVLDLYRREFIHYPLSAQPITASGGTLLWYDYAAPGGFFEATTGGTAVFYVQDSTGATLGSALWSADYRRGVITLVSDGLGTALYITGRSYDMNAAAANVWRKKASHYAPTSFNFSTDNHRVDREQVYTHCNDMAAFFAGMSGQAIQTAELYRSDM